MPKKLKVTSKKHKEIKVTGKYYPKISPKELANILGAKVVTDPEEIAELEKKKPRRP